MCRSFWQRTKDSLEGYQHSEYLDCIILQTQGMQTTENLYFNLHFRQQSVKHGNAQMV